ncbi:MAG: YggU family protein [Deltaproteobacteria bacterium]|nr:YggU family protein [Deltaproteobacteria bacterium]
MSLITIPEWILHNSEGVVLKLQIQPKTSYTKIVGTIGDRLKIRIAAPPVDGAANKELICFLKKKLKIKNIQLLRGEKTKFKDVICRNITTEEVLIMLKSD